MANRHFGNDPFYPDPPTRLNLHSPKSPRTKKTPTNQFHNIKVINPTNKHVKKPKVTDSLASISENISKSGSFKWKSFENESDGYSDDFEEESIA